MYSCVFIFPQALCIRPTINRRVKGSNIFTQRERLSCLFQIFFHICVWHYCCTGAECSAHWSLEIITVTDLKDRCNISNIRRPTQCHYTDLWDRCNTSNEIKESGPQTLRVCYLTLAKSSAKYFLYFTTDVGVIFPCSANIVKIAVALAPISHLQTCQS